MNTYRLFLLPFAGLLAFVFTQNTVTSAGSEANGKKLYEKYCSTCHGPNGKGDGTAAVYLFPKPRNFTKGVFKFQSTPVGSLPTDQDLHRTIQQGMPGSAMPAWDRLTMQDRDDLVAFIKSLSERFRTESPADPVHIGNPPPPTPAMIDEGKAVYALAGCWQCHGTTGTGDGPSAAMLADDEGRPIRPYNFTRAGAFKGGGSPQDIYRTFSTGIGGTPMPGYGEDALVPARETVSDLSFLEGAYSLQDVEVMKKFTAQFPTEAELRRMSPEERRAVADKRRWALVYYVLSLSQPGKTQLSYTTTDHQLTATSVQDAAPYADPVALQWNDVEGTEVALISLWQRETPTDRVAVKSVTDGKSIVFRLEWEDPTRDDQALHVSKFGDGAAIQFPIDPASDPFFGMGDTSFAVNIWHWKSWWERDRQQFAGVNAAFPNNAVESYFFDVSGGSTAEYFASKDSAKKLSMTWNAGWGSENLLSAQVRRSSVEDLIAKGFGTLRSQPASEQNVAGRGFWKNGKWSVTFMRTLATSEKNDVQLARGRTIPVAFAVWDGSLNDRNGQKMVTDWYRLTIR